MGGRAWLLAMKGRVLAGAHARVIVEEALLIKSGIQTPRLKFLNLAFGIQHLGKQALSLWTDQTPNNIHPPTPCSAENCLHYLCETSTRSGQPSK